MERPHIRSNFFRLALEVIWLATIFLIPLFFNPLSNQVFVLNKALLLQFLVMTMLAFWMADWLFIRAGRRESSLREIFASPLHISILVFGLITAVATITSITPVISFWGSYYREAGLLTLLCWIIFFLIVAQQLRTRTQMLRAIYVLLLSSAVVSVIGVWQNFLPDLTVKIFNWPYNGRVFSTVGNPLFLSSFLSMVIPFNLALIIYSWYKRREGNHAKILVSLIILLALQFWCLWLAQYSITILLYVISFIVFVLLLGIVKRKKLMLGLGAAAVLTLVIVASLLVMPLLFPAPSTENTGASKDLVPVPLSEEIGLQTLGWRVQYWQSTINLLVKSPEVPFSHDKLHFLRKVIGYGPETFIVTFQLVFPEKMKSEYTYQSLLVDRPHNDYLYLAATVGLLGLMSFLSILAVFFYLCLRYLRRAREDIDKLLLMAMVAAIVQYMADIFFNLSTISPEVVFWLILAMTPVIGGFTVSKKTAGRKLKGIEDNDNEPASHISGTRLFSSVACAVTLIVIGLGIAAGPFMADMYFEKGQKLQGEYNEPAVNAFEKATRLDTGEAYYWHSLGAYYDSLARNIVAEPLKAQVLWRAGIAYNMALELRNYVAFEHYSPADFYTHWSAIGAMDKWPAALSLYDEASQLFPDNAVILDKWALALILKGDLVEAGTKLNQAASSDPGWARTSFLSGLLLAEQGKNYEAVLKITQPIQNKSANLNYFIDLCFDLTANDMVLPLQGALGTHTGTAPEDWAGHAMLGITSLFTGNLDGTLNELDVAVKSVPVNNVGGLFGAIIRLSTISPGLKSAIPGVAAEWRDKLNQSPERDTLLPALDRLVGAHK
jgi:tetratricopeptide (TPR) repeat protein